MRRFVKGFRGGHGEALAVIQPASLVELWRVLQACVEANAVIIMQAANTGLTGGSTPRDEGYDRSAIVVSTVRIKGIHYLDDASQVICYPGATLNELEGVLAKIGREPHSVIGSSCIGASVVGGVCNNSGGGLLRRGPAYTELSLYARVDEYGQLSLVNELGVDLPDDPEAALALLDQQAYSQLHVHSHPQASASARDYQAIVRDVDSPTPARYNADARRLHGASGSAGRVAVFAVRLDTFPKDEDVVTFYLGTNEAGALGDLRREMLTACEILPISAEYLDRKAFDLADRYGKDTFLAIRWFGTAALPNLMRLKSRFDDLLERFGYGGGSASGILLHALSRLAPDHLPVRLRRFRDAYAHHLLLKIAGPAVPEARAILKRHENTGRIESFECTPNEGVAAALNRYAVAGAAVSYRNVNRAKVEGIVSIDVALPRNLAAWWEEIPTATARDIVERIYYGHFFCHVFHQEYIVRRGADLEAIEAEILAGLRRRGGKYPAEHNVGHHYTADPDLRNFYEALDPGNRFNPGIGKTPCKST